MLFLSCYLVEQLLLLRYSLNIIGGKMYLVLLVDCAIINKRKSCKLHSAFVFHFCSKKTWFMCSIYSLLNLVHFLICWWKRLLVEQQKSFRLNIFPSFYIYIILDTWSVKTYSYKPKNPRRGGGVEVMRLYIFFWTFFFRSCDWTM